MSECPYVDRSFTPTPEHLNQPIEYVSGDGTAYVFYEHDDGWGSKVKVQFCKLIGRKGDVFECLNESEWRCCSYYRHVTAGLSKYHCRANDNHLEAK